MNDWHRLTFGSREQLKRSLLDDDQRIIFWPGLDRLSAGEHVDIEIRLKGRNISFPMRALVTGRRTVPAGRDNPKGVFLSVIPEDAKRFSNLFGYAYGTWAPPPIVRHPRVRVALRVTYYHGSDYHSGWTRDLSASGLFVHTEGLLPAAGSGVFVRLRPSFFSWPIRIEARVCWIDMVESRRGMGLYCQNTSARKRLASLVLQKSERTPSRLDSVLEFGSG